MALEDTHLGVGCILLEDIRLEVAFFLLDPGLARDLVGLLRNLECPSIHLVMELLVGLLGHPRSTLLVRVSSLLEAVLREPAVVSILQGLVHQVHMDRAQTDQGQTGQVQMDQALMARVPTVQALMVLAPMALALRAQVQVAQDLMVQGRMDPDQMGLVQMVQGRMGQVQTDPGRMVPVQMGQAQTDPGRMVLVPMGQVPMDLARMELVSMDLVQVASLGVEAAAKSRRSSPPRNMSAQLRLHLHHAPLHQQPSWQNAWKLLGAHWAMHQSPSLEDQIAHFALLARFALSPRRRLCKYRNLI